MKKNLTVQNLVLALLLSVFVILHTGYAYAQVTEGLAAGSYPVSASLSCYINAMGGVEFGAPMLKSTTLTVAADGTKTLTLHLQKSVVNIYSVTCDTFIDATPAGAESNGSVASGTIGYYNGSGTLITTGVNHTLSSDTAINSKQEEVHYVNSITFPLESETDTYKLSLYINSNVMGTQFSSDTYPAILTVNWDSLQTADTAFVPETTISTESAASETPIAETSGAVTETTSAVKETTGAVAETMKGLNIYRAETEEEVLPSVEETIVSVEKADGYTAYFDRTVLAIAATAGIMLIVTGIVLIILGNREEKRNEK